MDFDLFKYTQVVRTCNLLTRIFIDIAVHMTNEFLISLGQNISEERRKKGMSQSDLGAIIGIEKHHLSRIENGRKDISARTLVRIARGLDVSVDVLVGDLLKE